MHLELARLQLCQVKHIIDQVTQIAHIPFQPFERPVLVFVERSIDLTFEGFQGHGDRLKRRTQIVADIGEKKILQVQCKG